jgi:hypothetical protein
MPERKNSRENGEALRGDAVGDGVASVVNALAGTLLRRILAHDDEAVAGAIARGGKAKGVSLSGANAWETEKLLRETSGLSERRKTELGLRLPGDERARRVMGYPDEHGGDPADVRGNLFDPEPSAGAGMAEVSDFFRRDARRYDGGYERY